MVMHPLLTRLCNEHDELVKFLTGQQQLSFLEATDSNFRKSLVLSAASLAEYRVTEALVKYVDHVSNGNSCITSLVRIKAVDRQYHTYFDWKDKKAGQFFKLLGDEIGAGMKKFYEDEEKKQDLSAFLEIGSLRNCLVHQNFAEYSIDKTSNELIGLCQKAEGFLLEVESRLSVGS